MVKLIGGFVWLDLQIDLFARCKKIKADTGASHKKLQLGSLLKRIRMFRIVVDIDVNSLHPDAVKKPDPCNGCF